MSASSNSISGGYGGGDPTMLGVVTPLAGSSGNLVAAAGSATLTPPAGKLAYIANFTVTGGGATLGLMILVTVTGLAAGTQTYAVGIPAGALLGIAPFVVNFPYPLPASAPGVPIVVNIPSFGLGNTNAAVTAAGCAI